jgi:PAS domain-containing protein
MYRKRFAPEIVMPSNGMNRPPETGHAQQEAGFRLLVERMPAAAYVCDAEGLITYFNPRAAEFWGREPRLYDPSDRF